MSDYGVLAAVGEGLRRILWQEFQTDPVVNGIVGAQAAIVFANPAEAAQDSANRLSLWLYHITENEFVKNQPLLPGPTPDERRFPPLPLNLSYLVTPLAQSGHADALLLGKAMQVFHDNAITLLQDTVADVHEELRIWLARLTLDELTGVWQALREPYRLSVGYLVHIMRVDSKRTTRHARVVDRVAEYGELTGAPT